MKKDPWYEVRKIRDDLIAIRERLDLVEPRFLTLFTNMYLLLGEEKALLIDTGCGISPIAPIISPFVQDRELIVINTHHHFDHVLGNNEFPFVYIHRHDLPKIIRGVDVSFLEDSESNESQLLYYKGPLILTTSELRTLYGDEEFDLGGLSVQVVHTPGHTQGSVCLISSKGDFFTGDTVHFGTVYLSTREALQEWIESVETLVSKSYLFDHIELFPGHESFLLSRTVLTDFLEKLKTVENKPPTQYNEYLKANLIFDGPFVFAREW